MEWTFEPPQCFHIECWWQRKPSRTTLNQNVSLVKAVKTQYAEHLQILIKGIDSKDRLIKMEPSLHHRTHPLSGASPGLRLLSPPCKMENWNFPWRRIWQRQLSLPVCMDKHVHELMCFWETVHVGMCFWHVYMLGCIYLYFCETLWIFQSQNV